MQSPLVAGVLLLALSVTGHALRAAEPTVEQHVRSVTAEGHVEGIFCVAFSPDGKRLASGGDEGEIVLWDTSTWRELRQLASDPGGGKGHFEDVWGLAFSPDGRRLASASHDETVRIWDTNSGKQLQVLKGHSFHVWGVAYSPDGKRLASAGSASDERGQFTAGEIKVWDVTTGQALLTMQAPASRVYSVAFSPDGATLASAWEDKTVKAWDATSGKQLFTFEGHMNEVNVVAWSPDGKQLASGGEDRTVRLWDVAARKEIRTLRGYHGVAFSADGALLATGGDAGIAIWDTATGAEIRRLDGAMSFSKLALSPHGRQLVWDDGIRTLRVWAWKD